MRAPGPVLWVRQEGDRLRAILDGVEKSCDALGCSQAVMDRLLELARALEQAAFITWHKSRLGPDYAEALRVYQGLETRLGQALAGLLFGWNAWREPSTAPPNTFSDSVPVPLPVPVPDHRPALNPGARNEAPPPGPDQAERPATTRWALPEVRARATGNGLCRLLRHLLERTPDDPYLRLVLDFHDPLLAALPWELLRWPWQPDVRLSVDARLTLTRGPGGHTTPAPFPYADPPLEVRYGVASDLEGTANPPAAGRQTLGAVIESGLEPLVKEGHVVITSAPASAASPQTRPAVVHLQAPSGTSTLAEARERHLVSPDLRAPALLVLTPTFGGLPERAASPSQDALEVASQCLDAGARAVLHTTAPLRTYAAKVFCRAFYEALGARHPVDYAVQLARRRLYADALTLTVALPPDHWFRPVLVIQALDDLDLFNAVSCTLQLEARHTGPHQLRFTTQAGSMCAELGEDDLRECLALAHFYSGLEAYPAGAPVIDAELGRHLGRLLFPPALRSGLDRLRRRARATGARIDLALDFSRPPSSGEVPGSGPRAQNVSPLHGMRWETLALPGLDASSGSTAAEAPREAATEPLSTLLRLSHIEPDCHPLLIDERLFIQRTARGGAPLPPPPPGPLRILLAAWPGAGEAVGLLKRSLDQLKEGLLEEGETGPIQLEVLYGTQLPDLARRVQDPGRSLCHVVHLAGWPAGGLEPRLVGEVLRRVPLVTLGAAEGVALAVELVNGGVSRAIALSGGLERHVGRLLRRLARGEPMNEALSELRSCLRREASTGACPGKSDQGLQMQGPEQAWSIDPSLWSITEAETTPALNRWSGLAACGGPWDDTLVAGEAPVAGDTRVAGAPRPPARAHGDVNVRGDRLRSPFGLGEHPTGVQLERDVELLRAEWVLSRPGHHLALTGFPGVGKTLVAAHLCEVFLARGLQPMVLRGRVTLADLRRLVRRSLQTRLLESLPEDTRRVVETLVHRLRRATGNEAIRLLCRAWPHCRALLVLEDFNQALTHDREEGRWRAAPEMPVAALSALMTVESPSRLLFVSRIPLPDELLAPNLASMPLAPLELDASRRLLALLPHIHTGSPERGRARAALIHDRLDGIPGAFAYLERLLSGRLRPGAGAQSMRWPFPVDRPAAPVDDRRLEAALEATLEAFRSAFTPLLEAVSEADRAALERASLVRRGASVRYASLLDASIHRLEARGLLIPSPEDPDSVRIPRPVYHVLRPSPAVHGDVAGRLVTDLVARLNRALVPGAKRVLEKDVLRPMAESYGRPEIPVPLEDAPAWLEARRLLLVAGDLERAGRIEALLAPQLHTRARAGLARELIRMRPERRVEGEAWLRLALACDEEGAFRDAMGRALRLARASRDRALELLIRVCLLDVGVPRFGTGMFQRPAGSRKELYDAVPGHSNVPAPAGHLVGSSHGPSIRGGGGRYPELERLFAATRRLARSLTDTRYTPLRVAALRVVAQTARDHGMLSARACLKRLEGLLDPVREGDFSPRVRVDLHFCRFTALLELGAYPEEIREAANDTLIASGAALPYSTEERAAAAVNGALTLAESRRGVEALKGLYASAVADLWSPTPSRQVVACLDEVRRISALTGHWPGEVRSYYALMCYYRKTGQARAWLETAALYLLVLRRQGRLEQEVYGWSEALRALEAVGPVAWSSAASIAGVDSAGTWDAAGGPAAGHAGFREAAGELATEHAGFREATVALAAGVCRDLEARLAEGMFREGSALEACVQVAVSAYRLGAASDAVALAGALAGGRAETLSRASAERLLTLPLEGAVRERLERVPRTQRRRHPPKDEDRRLIHNFLPQDREVAIKPVQEEGAPEGLIGPRSVW